MTNLGIRITAERFTVARPGFSIDDVDFNEDRDSLISVGSRTYQVIDRGVHTFTASSNYSSPEIFFTPQPNVPFVLYSIRRSDGFVYDRLNNRTVMASSSALIQITSGIEIETDRFTVFVREEKVSVPSSETYSGPWNEIAWAVVNVME